MWDRLKSLVLAERDSTHRSCSGCPEIDLLDLTKSGADIFYGDKNGLFGEFDDNDRLVMGIECGW